MTDREEGDYPLLPDDAHDRATRREHSPGRLAKPDAARTVCLVVLMPGRPRRRAVYCQAPLDQGRCIRVYSRLHDWSDVKASGDVHASAWPVRNRPFGTIEGFGPPSAKTTARIGPEKRSRVRTKLF